MLKTSDGTQIKRISKIGDRQPALGGRKQRALYTATGGETSIDLSLLTPSLSYTPSANQISVKRTSGSGLISGIDFYERTATSIGFPITDPLLSGEIVEILLDFGITSVMALAPRPDCYSQTATAGQTLITADFSWTYNLNPSKAIGGVRVEINGVTQTRGVDFTEVNLSNVNTNQVILVDALLGGENIILTPAYQALDTSAASTSFYGQAYSNMQSVFTAGTQSFIDQSSDMIAVPNTAIVGRAKIPNLANDLRASLGIDRIATQSIVRLQNEVGINGEPVFSVLNDDRGLIRFVGGGWMSVANTDGVHVGHYNAIDDYVEITFFGTRLNILSVIDTARDYRVSVDGGLEGGNIFVNGSPILSGRNYPQNAIFTATSELQLGVHTVKIRNNSTTFGIKCCGFEIINSNASGIININPGVGYINGQKYTNTLVDSVAYNAGVTGTKGGRVVRYLNADGTVGQAVTLVDAVASTTLTNVNHTNEEVVRPYNWREFGAGRNPATAGQAFDDFSTPSVGSTNRAFTLDDGTTTLVGYGVDTGAAVLYHLTGTSFTTITFVGTGLDIDIISVSGGAQAFSAVYVDGGSSIGSITMAATGARRIQKVVSGLPYGTHTVKFYGIGTSYSMGVHSFIVYQPKKPTIPATAIELCDYNVMADFVANTTAGLETIGTGVLRKELSQREATYVDGTTGPQVWALTQTSTLVVGGWESFTDKLNAYVQYSFFGTGFDFRYLGGTTRSANVGVTVDTLVLNQTNFTGMTYSNYGGGSFTGGVGGTGILTLSTTANYGCGFSVKGLPLGLHTVKFNNGTASSVLIAEALDIITPIHAVKSNLYADIQNTLPVGSCSLTDSRKTSLIKEALPAQKAWAQAVGVSSSPTTTSTGDVPCPDLSCTIKTSGGPVQISFGNLCNGGGTYYVGHKIYVDGSPIAIPVVLFNSTNFTMAQAVVIVPLSAGTHKVDIYWYSNGVAQTITANGTQRLLTVQEI